MLKKQKGITLIALVVTIVVLLILAGVTISLLLDENGIISKSKDVRNKWAEAQEKEQKEMDDFVKENFSNWDGKQTEMPEIKKNETTGKFDWYIYNESQMKFLANYVNNTLTEQDQKMITDNNTTVEDIAITEETTIYLMNDLNLGATFDSTGNLISGEQWIPIGATKDKTMLGTFEGNNHYICGVYINRNEKFNGIFGNCNSIKNLTIKNSYIEGLNCTGGIAGVARKGTVENCHNNNTTVVLKKGSNRTAGGIVGQFGNTENNLSYSNLSECYNSGNIIAKDLSDMEAGGIIGTIRNRGREDIITRCYSKGNIINAKEKCGAIIGYDENTEPKAKLSKLYYLNSVGVGAMNNSDDKTRKLQAVEDDVKTYEEFLEWIKNK